jgi:hypothetical protein
VNERRRPLHQLPRPARSEDDESETVFLVLEAVFYSDARHELSDRGAKPSSATTRLQLPKAKAL